MPREEEIKGLIKKLGYKKHRGDAEVPDWGAINKAKEKLVKIGPAAVAPLIKALEDKDEDMRREAAEALGKIGHPDAVGPLAKVLEDENESYIVRNIAAEALGKIGHPDAVPPLINILKDNEIAYFDIGLTKTAAEALGKIGKPAVPYLIKALEDRDEDVRPRVAEALGKIGKPAVPHLTKVLQNENETGILRRAAVIALGEIGHPDAVKPLVEALKKGDIFLRLNAAEALGKIGHPDAIPHLAEALKDKDKDVKWRAAKALGEIGHPDAVPHLIKALGDKEEDVREEAVRALGKIAKKLSKIPPKEDEPEEMRALRLVGKHFVENEEPKVIRNAFEAALRKEIDEKNAAIYVKQLRALKGNLK